MSQTPTPEALAAADNHIEWWLCQGGMMKREDLAEAFDAHTRDLQNTIARLTREIAEARDAEAAEIAAWLYNTSFGEDAFADAIALHEHRKD